MSVKVNVPPSNIEAYEKIVFPERAIQEKIYYLFASLFIEILPCLVKVISTFFIAHKFEKVTGVPKEYLPRVGVIGYKPVGVVSFRK